MIDRPDWNFDTQSKALVPTDAAVDLDTVPAGTVLSGETIVRSIVAKQNGDPVGISKELRQTWDNEGGFDANLKAAQDRANHILGAADDPAALTKHFDGLPQSIQQKAFDVLRLSPSRRPTAATDMLDLIERSLTPDELNIAEAWLRKLTPGQMQALYYGLGAR